MRSSRSCFSRAAIPGAERRHHRRRSGRDQESGHRQTIRVGDTIKILDQPFRISGIVDQGKGGRKLIPIDTMGELMGAEGKASMFYIKCDNPANDDQVMQEIRATRGFGNNTLVDGG